jgi:purine-cytosine permease-like protein
LTRQWSEIASEYSVHAKEKKKAVIVLALVGLA